MVSTEQPEVWKTSRVETFAPFIEVLFSGYKVLVSLEEAWECSGFTLS